MQKATAVCLFENTALSFNQISEFCGLHELEVQGIADGDAGWRRADDRDGLRFEQRLEKCSRIFEGGGMWHSPALRQNRNAAVLHFVAPKRTELFSDSSGKPSLVPKLFFFILFLDFFCDN